MKQNCDRILNEEPKYTISLKKCYRILYMAMSVFFLVCTLYSGIISFSAGVDTMLFGSGITGIFLMFLSWSLYGLTKKCERCFKFATLAFWSFGKEIVYGNGMFSFLVNLIYNNGLSFLYQS